MASSLDVHALEADYLAAANDAQQCMDTLSFAVGTLVGLARRGDSDDDVEQLRDDVTEHLRRLRLAIDDVDSAIASHLHDGAAAMTARCLISEVRGREGLVRCELAADHAGPHSFPATGAPR